MVNIEEEIQLLEDAATNAVVEFETTIMERKKFEEANAQLIEEKAALMKRIEVEQGDLSSYTERQAKVAAQKADMEAQVLVMKEKLAAEEEKKETFLAEKKAIEQEASSVRGELCDLEVAVSKVEQERSTKDHAIRSLNDEIAAKDELINKLNKVLMQFIYENKIFNVLSGQEKKHIQEVNSKASEELQAADEKVFRKMTTG